MVTVVYFLHVLLAFIAIAFLVVPGLILEMAARTKDVSFIRRLFPWQVFTDAWAA